jgi:hypothetical protein
MLKINDINRKEKLNPKPEYQSINLRKEGIMKSLDWTRKLIMMILENLEKFSGKEIKNNPFDRLIPEYIPVVPYNKNSNRIS